MKSIKTILVTGGTGRQGGAVANSLIKKDFKIKVLTRNPASIHAQNLLKLGVEIIIGDLNDIGSFENELKDVDGIFSVQSFEKGIDREIRQGLDLADLAKRQGVAHFIYSSVAGADLNTGIPHFESKLIIENHIKQTGLSYTIIRPNSFFENFLIPQVSSRIAKGKLASPINKDKRQQFLSVADIGEISANIFLNTDKYLNKTITMASEEMDMQQVAHTFTEVLGKSVTYQKLPMFITRLVMGKNLYKMFKWINENDAIFMQDLAGFKKEYPNQISFKSWIGSNFKTN